MKIPLSWLNDYVEVADLDIGEQDSGWTWPGWRSGSVEAIGYPGAELPWDPERVMTAAVLAVRPHPNAGPAGPGRGGSWRGGARDCCDRCAEPLCPQGADGPESQGGVRLGGRGALRRAYAEGFIKARLKKMQISGRALACDGLFREGTGPLRGSRGHHLPS